MTENDLLKEIIALLDSDDTGNAVSVINDKLTLLLENNNNQVSEYFANLLQLAMRGIQYKIDLMETDPYQLKKGYDYLQKYLSYADDSVLVPKHEPVIWWCWLQGLESAPPIVKACYRSLKILNMKVNIITSDNYDQYVNIPTYILDKWKAGIISDAHFSDLLRLELLTSRGGIWVDATVFVTGNKSLKLLQDRKLFVFSHVMRGMESEYIRASHWLIASDGNSSILRSTKKMLYSYWKNENKLENYFLFHLFFAMASLLYKDEWQDVPSYSNVPPHMLQQELFQPYTEIRWQQLCQMSDFHKLTYLNVGMAAGETFYDYIVKMYT